MRKSRGGPLGDQSIKAELQPSETKSHVEYWFPTDHELDIYSLKTPPVHLRALNEVPLFEWAREKDVKIWKDLNKGYRARNKHRPDPPQPDQNLWAPSGMENLDLPFKWVIGDTKGQEQDLWRFHYGTWLAGSGKTEEAIRIFSTAKTGLAKAMLARLLMLKGDPVGAKKAYDEVKEKWLQLHPQIVVERDQILRATGSASLPEREKWLSEVDALKDEWISERRVQLFLDKGQLKEAKDFLLSMDFQKVHQTYTRTDLWTQICQKLNQPCLPIPSQLGEDRLARFGAYREFETKKETKTP